MSDSAGLPDDLANWHLSDPATNARGAKTAQLLSHGQPVSLKLTSLGEPLLSPWGAGTFDKEAASSRLSIDFAASPRLQRWCERVDEWAVEYLARESQRLFKKPLSRELVAASYKPLLARRGNYAPTVKCKLNLTGRGAVRCWGQDLRQRPPAAGLEGRALRPSGCAFSPLDDGRLLRLGPAAQRRADPGAELCVPLGAGGEGGGGQGERVMFRHLRHAIDHRDRAGCDKSALRLCDGSLSSSLNSVPLWAGCSS